MYFFQKEKGEGRLISVLADGMGHGVKANVLGTLTASMSINFCKTKTHKLLEYNNEKPSLVKERVMNLYNC